MPAHDQGVGIFNCAVGADQTAVSTASGDSVLNFLGASIAAAAAAATLTIYDGTVAQGIILATLAAPIGQMGSISLPTFYACQKGTLHYSLVGAGATAQIYWNTG